MVSLGNASAVETEVGWQSKTFTVPRWKSPFRALAPNGVPSRLAISGCKKDAVTSSLAWECRAIMFGVCASGQLT
jgi:hypothetical protein